MWTAIKLALNSTLGKPNFEPLDSVISKEMYSATQNLIRVTAFLNGQLPSTVLFPDNSLNYVPSQKYADNIRIQAVIIPEGFALIGDGAFEGCTQMTTAIIPKTVLTIGENAFSGCTSLHTFDYQGTIQEWQNVSLGLNWNANVSSNFKIHCIDGDAS